MVHILTSLLSCILNAYVVPDTRLNITVGQPYVRCWYAELAHDNYDAITYLQGHKASKCKGLSKICIGMLAPYIITKFGCESMFSKVGYATHHNHTRTVI